MPFQQQGYSGVVSEVDGTTHRAARVTLRPYDYGSLGYYRLSQESGVMAVALAANSEIYQFRWTDATRLALVQSIILSAGATGTPSAAALLTYQAMVARAFTVDGSGGVAATITGNNAKLRTSMGTTLLGTSRIASTAALGVGTKTLDTQGIGNISIGVQAVAWPTVSILIPRTALFDASGEGQHPLVLVANEGFVIRTGANAHPATGMTWTFGVTVVWAEVSAY